MKKSEGEEMHGIAAGLATAIAASAALSADPKHADRLLVALSRIEQAYERGTPAWDTLRLVQVQLAELSKAERRSG